MNFPVLRALLAALLLSALCSAATLSGSVTNRTTGKPAAGDDVVLLSLSQGMSEAGRTKTDARGRFSFQVPGEGPHLVRVNHQNVNYFSKGGPVMPGTGQVAIDVYDAAPIVPGVSLTINMFRIEADGSNLRVSELYVVSNKSDPPRTQMSDRAFEIFLPEGAQIEQSFASGPGGQPVNSAPVPTGDKNRYAYVFPLRPGETRFQLGYRLPYSGAAEISPRLLYPAEHVVVLLPKSMQFTSQAGATYQAMQDEGGAELRVAIGIVPGQQIGFRVAGTGTIQDAPAAAGGDAQGANRGRPGGGLGAPVETPDPLHQYRWYLLGVLAAAMALGAFYVVTRQHPAPVAVVDTASIPGAVRELPLPAETPVAAPTNGDRLLEALKEELFQLEMDRHAGSISPEEYDKSKAALDHTIARAAARRR